MYDTLTLENITQWVDELPPHHKSKITKIWMQAPSGSSPLSSLDQEAKKEVEDLLGGRPPFYMQAEDLTEQQFQDCRDHTEWVRAYEKRAKPRVFLSAGVALQQQQRALSMALGSGARPMDTLPDQADGLDLTQAATVRWLQLTGETPLEFLADTYRNSLNKPNDRISAARALLDYVHRKIPAGIDITAKHLTPTLDPTLLSSLSKKDLATLESLLEKMKKVS